MSILQCLFLPLGLAVPAASPSAPGCHAGVYETTAGTEESKKTLCVFCEAGKGRPVRGGEHFSHHNLTLPFPQLVQECRLTLKHAIAARSFYRKKVAIVTRENPAGVDLADQEMASYEDDMKHVLEVTPREREGRERLEGS